MRPSGAAAGHGRDLARLALLDRNFGDAVDDREIDRRRRQPDIERHAVVLGGQRLQVSADLVADIALRGDAVGADDDDIHLPVLHQVPAGIVGDHGMRNAVLAEFEGGERGALIARPRLVDPDMDRDMPLSCAM